MSHLDSVINEVTTDGSFMQSYQRWLSSEMAIHYPHVFGDQEYAFLRDRWYWMPVA